MHSIFPALLVDEAGGEDLTEVGVEILAAPR